jgi:hypothetical protein
MAETPGRAHLRQELEAHLARLGYSLPRVRQLGTHTAEVARVNPVRGRMAYGATVLRADLKRPRCHQQLLFFSQRRTRRRSSIPFFIAVGDDDRAALESLLEELGIRDGVRGGHVQIVSVARKKARAAAATPATKASAKAAKPAQAARK